MPLINHWKLEGRRLDSVLEPGETVLAFTQTGLGHTHFESLSWFRPKITNERPSLLWRVAGAIGAVVGFVPSLVDRLGDRFQNDAVGGPDPSTARTIGRLVDAAPLGHQRYLAVTDRRFVVLHGSADPRDPLTVIADVERSGVGAAEVRSNRLAGSLGRLRVTFSDGSWLEFADVLNMGRARAGAVRDALVEGRRSVDGEPGPPGP